MKKKSTELSNKSYPVSLGVLSLIKVKHALVVLTLGLVSSTANAEWVELGNIDSSIPYTFSRNFNLDTSNYVSEPNIASNTLTFSLTSAQNVTFFSDNFAFTNANTEMRQIDLLNRDQIKPGQHVGYITGIGDFTKGLNGELANFSYLLQPGSYQVNYKVRGQEVSYSPDRKVGTAVTGLGTYRLGLNIGGSSNQVAVAVPEPETYAMLLAGLALVGFGVRRQRAS